eukprot:6050474-Amphidinium_carterae.2
MLRAVHGHRRPDQDILNHMGEHTYCLDKHVPKGQRRRRGQSLAASPGERVRFQAKHKARTQVRACMRHPATTITTRWKGVTQM